MADTTSFVTHDDLAWLARRGIGAEEVRRQGSLLAERPSRIRLDRPCAPGDGIWRLAESEQGELLEAHRGSVERGRWCKFVPASGAASRMFALRSGEERTRFCRSLDRFAFADEVRRELASRGISWDRWLGEGRCDELVESVVGPSGLGYGSLPKGLVEFHRYGDRCRTPFEEHLLEGRECLSGGPRGELRAHFTIAPEHRERFDECLRRFEQSLGDARARVEFSGQSPATDTIAMDDRGRLLRTADGRPMTRPGGHGALIENLNELRGDLIFVKNIDNVPHQHARDETVRWIRLLGGYLTRIQSRIHRHLGALRAGAPGAEPEAAAFVRATFLDADAVETREALVARLDRPVRVCGMVRNEGDAGGGPFWVRAGDGERRPQIVEAAEVDAEDDAQSSILRQSTHFNPVFMALGVRDERGEAYDLRRFVDQDRVILTQKTVDGRTATVLERPGLWNGGMARWNSVFVEVPREVFAPVKNVLDLLGEQHQPLAPDRPSSVS